MHPGKEFSKVSLVLSTVLIGLCSGFNSISDKKNQISMEIADAVSECAERLSAAVEKAYADVGLRQEDVATMLKEIRQAGPPQKFAAKWRSYEKVRNELRPLRQPAIEDLTRLGPDAVAILLRTESQTLRFAGLHDVFFEAIVRIGSPAVPALVDELSGAEVMPRLHAVTALGRIGDPAAVEHLIRSLSDPDKRIVRAAVSSLGALKDKRATEPLLELWHENETIARSSIASALGRIGDARAAKPIIDALEEYVSHARKTGNWDVNSWDMLVHARALGQIGDPRAIGLLKKMLLAEPQRTKAPTPRYQVAEAAAVALRSLGVEVTGDIEKGNYQIVRARPQEWASEPGEIKEIRSDASESSEALHRRDFAAALSVPQPIELWTAKEYGCGGNPRTQEMLWTDEKRRYPVSLTWPMIQEADKYVVQIKGIRGSQPAASFESVRNRLYLEESDITPGRYQWSVSVYDDRGRFMGDIETVDPAEIFAVADPEPVEANGRKALIDLSHSAGHMRGWAYYNHAQYMTKELLENAGFEVEINDRDLLTPARLESVDLLICNYYWTGWPGFRSYLKSEISAVRDFVYNGGSLLLVGCDRKDGGNQMSAAGNELAREFGLKFELDEISKQNGMALPDADQNIISFSKPLQVQLPVGIRGQAGVTLVRFDEVPIAKAGQFGDGRVVVAGTGMSFLDCYLGDFQNREPLHLMMFYDLVRYLTGVDWRKDCKQEFVEKVLSRCSPDRRQYRYAAN